MKKVVLLFITIVSTICLTAQNQTVNGSLNVTNNVNAAGLSATKQIKVAAADNVDNASPGLIAVYNDDFLFKGKYLNNYGSGFYVRDSDTYLRSYYSDYFGIDFFTQSKHRMTILNNGYVGIGIENPKNLLEVAGTIRAKEVKIESTGWADYVFDKDYVLPSLLEVEAHIKAKGHLLDIPSQTEVKENGVDVGEIQVKLLQKIEELTLYTIQQQKQLEEQGRLIRGLQEQLENK